MQNNKRRTGKMEITKILHGDVSHANFSESEEKNSFHSFFFGRLMLVALHEKSEVSSRHVKKAGDEKF